MTQYWTSTRKNTVIAALAAAGMHYDDGDGITFHHTGAKANTVTIRRGFFYRNGFDDFKFAEAVTAAGLVVDEHRENWQAWPKDSYWLVRFHLAEAPTVETPAAPEPIEMPAMVMPPMDDSAVMPMTYTDWLILTEMAKAEGKTRREHNSWESTFKLGELDMVWILDQEWFPAEYLLFSAPGEGSHRIDKRDTVRKLAAWVNLPAPVEPTPEPAADGMPAVGDTISYNRKGLRMRPMGEVIAVEPAAPAYVVIKSFTGIESRVMVADIVTIIPADESPDTSD